MLCWNISKAFLSYPKKNMSFFHNFKRKGRVLFILVFIFAVTPQIIYSTFLRLTMVWQRGAAFFFI